MPRIAKLSDEFYVNFDDHCLYSIDGNKIKEINGAPLEVLKYLCEYPNCPKRTNDINQALEEGCVTDNAIRSRVLNLRKSHSIFYEVIVNNGFGYKYIGKKIEDIGESSEGVVLRKESTNKVDVDEYASLLWKNRPFYQDDELISALFYRNNYNDGAGYDDNITSMIVDLLKQSYFKGKPISLNKLPSDISNKLIVIKESFILEDVFCEGKHLKDFNDPYDLLGLDEEKSRWLFLD